MSARDKAAALARRVLYSRAVVKRRFPDFDDETLEIIGQVMPFTLTSPQRVAALCQAVRYVESAAIPGAFVECGVWRGGSSMAAALQFREPRAFYLFDTFAGMSPPTDADVRIADQRSAKSLLQTEDKDSPVWGHASLEDVKRNLLATGYPSECIHYVQGMVEQTIPSRAPDQIAILRLDTDWYASTRHELVHLYPRLSMGGVLIVDDYGCWAGARKAVDEYFAGSGIFLQRIDAEGRLLIKSASDRDGAADER